MDRSERIGLGTAAAGHILLFAALSLGWLSSRVPPPPRQAPVEVSLVPDVALQPTAPAATDAPSQRVSPDRGEPVDAAPPPPEPAPAPKPVERTPPPEPVVKPKPRPEPVPPPKAAPRPAPAPKPVPPKPRPKPVAATPAPAKPVTKAPPAKAPAKPAQARTASSSSKTASTSTRTGNGATKSATAPRARGGRLGENFLAGLTAEKSSAKPNPNPPGAVRVDAKALAGIVAAIARQIQPCADRQVDPGPGANQITTVLNLRLNRDGTLQSAPRMVTQRGVDDDNRRYAGRVVELGVAAFKACAPLKLPAEYYATANGGWSNINYNWKLR